MHHGPHKGVVSVSVADIAASRFVNYGFAVAALPLGLSGALQTPAASAVETAAFSVTSRSSALTDTGQKVESDWLQLRQKMGDLVERSAVRVSPSPVSWFEVPGDAVYPGPKEIEVLEVSIVEDSESESFKFTDIDFDVWED